MSRKIVEEMWVQFKRKVIRSDATPEDLGIAKIAFFAGVHEAIGVGLSFANLRRDPEAIARFTADMRREARQFLSEAADELDSQTKVH